MQEAIGDKAHPMIQDLHTLIQVHHPAPDNNINVALVKDYVTQ